MIKLYGANFSTRSNKVRFLLNQAGLEYEYQQLNLMEGENKQDWFLELHPAGKVPVLVDDGFIIFESNAINRYLAQKYSSSLYPEDLQTRTVIDEWVDFVTQHVEAALNRVLTNRFMVKVVDFVTFDERSLQDGLAFLDRFLPIVEKQLQNNTYLAGDQLSLADINLLASFDCLELAQVDVSAYSAIVRWRTQLKKQEFYQQCFHDYNELFADMTV